MLISRVENMESPQSGRPVANQYIITEEGRGALGNFIERRTYQSYKSVIAVITEWENETEITLDSYLWDWSNTTLKYLKQFLGTTDSKKKIEKSIESGLYKTAKLNKVDPDGQDY